MCKFNLLNTRLLSKAAVLTAVGLFAGSGQEAMAQTCGNALATTPVIFPISGSKVMVGQSITITRVGLNSGDPGNCLFRNGEGYLVVPSGTVTKVVTNLNLNPPGGPPIPGTFINCFGTNNVAPEGTCLPFTTTYVVNAADVGQTRSIVLPARGQMTVAQTITFPGVANEVIFGAAADVDGFNPAAPDSATGFATGSGSQFLIVVHPGISVTKLCDTNCFAPGAAITFHGTVCNTGDVALANIAVTDVPAATITFAANSSLGTPFNPAVGLAPGECVNYSGTYNPAGNVCGPFPDTVVASGTASGVFNNPTISATNSATCQVCTTPCIAVTKNCSTNLLTLCNSNASQITFSGIVSNCGNITLTNVVLTDDLTAGVVARVALLAPGATAPWTTNFPVTAALCGRSNIVNTVTAIGQNICNLAQFVTNHASCSFTVICPAPSISITKACASPIVTNIGSSLTVTGQVCNTGNVAFDNVIVVDAQPGLPVSATNVIGTLAAGQCKPYSFTYTTTSCDVNHDTVTAIGTSSSCPGAPSVATASADCFLCCPGITIEKSVACLQPGAVCSGNAADYGQTATGVKGNTGDPAQDNPAFCYLIVVRNTGHDPLTNIVVIDDKLGPVGTFPGPLAVGGTITISNLRTNWDTTTTNTATVTAQCGGTHANGARVTASDTAVAVVVSANIACQKLVSVNGSRPVATYNAADCTTIATNIVWYVQVNNNGSAILSGIVVSELGTGPDLLPCGPVSLTLTNVLLPGQNTGLIPICSNSFSECVATNIDNSIRVVAHVSATNGCAINISGSNIVAESECRASLTLCCTPPVLGCRVTGGGRQDDPEVCPGNVRYVTHGGQVGAPVGNSNCVVTLDNIIGNPCIHGRWTHVRHTQGGLEGNFHARFYDTLDCACLAATPDASGLYADGNVVDGTCNPGDKIAGPEPRKAPANKIVFTGVGDWADPNGRREPRSVLFRVDIEDRSEPGGFHPGGAKPPADRYRIRIWVLTDAELAKLNNPSDGLLSFRNAIAACFGIKYQDGVLASAIANACGDSTKTISFVGGPAVRQPDIDDGGALEHGNHQIHPQIKACP